jgi:hypothetical protein
VITGFRLSDVECFVGAVGSENRCEFVESGGVYRAELGELAPYTGVTVRATVLGTTDVVPVDPPPLPERRTDDTLAMTVGVAALGVAGATPVYWWARRRGRNEVFAGGAAEAAYGTLPAPVPPSSRPPPRWSPTPTSASWRRSSSLHPRGSSRGRAPCCFVSGSTTARSRRGCPGWPGAR